MNMDKLFLFLFLLLSPQLVSAFGGQEKDKSHYENEIWRVYINTVDGELPTYEVATGYYGESIKNATKIPGRLKIEAQDTLLYDSGEYIEKESGITIKIRGNTSASRSPKKPYKIKLQKKADLLGRDDNYEDKDWLLIKSLGLNNFVGFKTNEFVNMSWTPSFHYVWVYLNEEAKGLYMLCESVKRNEKGRIKVGKSGFLFEYDAYWWNEEKYVPSNLEEHINYTFKYPDTEDLTDELLYDFKNEIDVVENAVKEGVRIHYLDVGSFVNWVLAHDFLGTFDYIGSNIYLCKYDENDIISMPTLWDFDGIMGSDENLPETFSLIHNFFYFKYLFKDPRFVNMYVERYKELSTQYYTTILDDIYKFKESEYGRAFAKAFEDDRVLWNYYYPMSIEEAFSKPIEWLSRRKNALDKAVEQMDGNFSGTNIRESKSSESIFNTVMYNLNGMQSKGDYKGILIKDGMKIMNNHK